MAPWMAGRGYTPGGLGFLVGSLLAGGGMGKLPPRAPDRHGARPGRGHGGGPVLPALPIPAVFALTGLGAAMTGIANVTVTLVLARESPAGRATTMAVNQAAFSVGSATGSALGGLLLALSGYHAIAAVLVWLCRTRAGHSPAPAAMIDTGENGPSGRLTAAW